MLKSHAEMRAAARRLGPKRVAVADADDDVALMAAAHAAEQRIASVVLIGDARDRFGDIGNISVLVNVLTKKFEEEGDKLNQLMRGIARKDPNAELQDTG